MLPSLLAALALSAPVPKLTPTMADVFGEPTAAKGDCTLEMSKHGALTVIVPTNHPRCDGSLVGRLQPLAAKTVRDDFVLTVRLTIDVSDEAASPGGLSTCAGCGVAVRSVADLDVGLVAGVERAPGRKGWSLCRRVSGFEPDRGNLVGSGRTTDGGTRVDSYLKLTRVGPKLTSEWSVDGVKWKDGYVWKITGLEDAVTVGPVAYQSTDKPFTATFEQYEMKLLEKEESK